MAGFTAANTKAGRRILIRAMGGDETKANARLAQLVPTFDGAYNAIFKKAAAKHADDVNREQRCALYPTLTQGCGWEGFCPLKST